MGRSDDGGPRGPSAGQWPGRDDAPLRPLGRLGADRGTHHRPVRDLGGPDVRDRQQPRTAPRGLDGRGRFDEDYPAGAEEIDFAWRAADLGYRFTYLKDALLHYRIRTDLRGVLRQQYNSGRGTTTLYAKFRPSEVVPKSAVRRIHHELLLVRRFPWRGDANNRRMWLTRMAFEAGKLVEARRRGVSAP